MRKILFLLIFTFGLLNQFNCQTEQALLESAKGNLSKGNYAEVLLTCAKILNKNDDNELAHLYKAEALLNIMQLDNSLKEIEKVLSINTKNSQAYNIKGKIKMRLYDFKKTTNCESAKEDFDIALKLNPNDIIVINNIAYYYQNCIGDVKSSIEQFNKSLAINENRLGFFNQLFA
jgi:tetratricopeptide (TPR) repeat protein